MDIIKEFLDYIKCKYEMIYTGKIELIKNGTSYSLYLGLNNVNRPLCIGGEFDTDQQFLDYIKKEFDERKLYNSEYFILEMKDPINLNYK